MNYKQREIVLIPFPFTDLTSAKKRPVLIISNDAYNSKHDDILIAAITSKSYSDEYSVSIDNDSLEYGILPEPSVIKVSKLFSAHRNLIIKKYSIINKTKFSEVTGIINNLISTKNK